MRKSMGIMLFAVAAVVMLAACNHGDTYADQKNRERSAINKFIKENGINVISESDFEEQNNVTYLDKNQFVLFKTTGVYMQIVRQGCGEKIKKGETCRVLCRYSEVNLLTDSLQSINNIQYWAAVVDKMDVTNTSGTFTASFVAGESVMASDYGSTAVPAGWLTPLSYINVGRVTSEDDELARVRLIVPHTQGQQYASSSVYPCYYEITYERGR